VDYDDEATRERVKAGMPQMQVYYLCILRKGPNWTAEESAELEELQEGHLANFARLRSAGVVAVNGPFLDRSAEGDDWRGFAIFTSDSLEKAERYMAMDPMIAAGHLAAEIRPIMAQRGVLD
jgi:uncharacterized protein YciI